MIKTIMLKGIVSNKYIGQRLDQVLTKLFPDYSRSCIKKWIINQNVLVNNKIQKKPKSKVLGGEYISIFAIVKKNFWGPQNIPLNIIYEDNDIIIVNKPFNLVVHPGAGNYNNTLLNALVYHYPPLSNLPRAGIVHRLDKNTTGLMVVAKTPIAQVRLIEMIKQREITRQYEAIVIGNVKADGTVHKPIGRHPIHRTRISVREIGKNAITHYQVIERFRAHTRLNLYLETGRTHQIRVHMAYIQHPIVGDPFYRGQYSQFIPPLASEDFINELLRFNRQALHASSLALYHPIQGHKMKWHAPTPKDMIKLIEVMRYDFQNYKNEMLE